MCHDDSLEKSGNVDDDTEDNDRNEELEDTLDNVYVGIIFSILVWITNCSESEIQIAKVNSYNPIRSATFKTERTYKS